MFQGCDKYFDKVKTDAKVTGACAVLFEENCCKSVGTFGDAKKLFVVPRGGKGKLCGTSKVIFSYLCIIDLLCMYLYLYLYFS